MTHKLSALALAAAVAGLVGCQSAQAPQSAKDTLVAIKAAAAPDMGKGAADPLWAKAQPLAVTLADGANFGAKPGEKADTKATIKAAYTGDMLYLLIQYADPTHSLRRGPYQKQADGTWKKLKDPADKGGDDNVYYEDKWAMIWSIGNSIPNFDKRGCAVACHIGEGKPYGNKYLREAGQLGDIWHMKGSRTAAFGLVDDQYLDHTRYDPKTEPNAGRKNEPGGPDYTGFPLENGLPKFMNRDGKPLNAGGTPYIKNGDQVPFDDSRFKPGDEVASYVIHQLKGDRADVRVNYGWKDGVHTSVVARKLVTGSKFDVQFSDLNAKYLFGFAAFDNAQVQHAMVDEPMTLVFGK